MNKLLIKRFSELRRIDEHHQYIQLATFFDKTKGNAITEKTRDLGLIRINKN